MYTRTNSCSRGNFVANLNRAWFSPNERITSNVRGKNNKPKLSPNRIKKIYDAVFQMYPVSQKENEKNAWIECVKAIDGANWQLKRTKGKKISFSYKLPNSCTIHLNQQFVLFTIPRSP